MKRGTSGLSGLICIDKPTNMTSHDVVMHVKKTLGEGRVGHAGTLDPLATGLMIIGVGQATRLLNFISTEKKRYEAEISFGSATNTDDSEGQIISQKPIPACAYDIEHAQQVLNNFRGTIQQVPPRFSAISVDGKRSYKRAREGESFDLPARTTEVYEAQLLSVEADEEHKSCIWKCEFFVAKGCYIRALARDIGEKMHTCAHISALRRTEIGCIGIDVACSLTDFVAHYQNSSDNLEIFKSFALNPCCILDADTYLLSDEEYIKASHGNPIEVPDEICSTLRKKYVVLVYEHKMIGLWQKQGTKLVCLCNTLTGIEGIDSCG